MILKISVLTSVFTAILVRSKKVQRSQHIPLMIFDDVIVLRDMNVTQPG